jgi:hypothetical protein
MNLCNNIIAAISTGVLQHTGMMQRVHRCAVGVWGKVENKGEKN